MLVAVIGSAINVIVIFSFAAVYADCKPIPG